MGGHAPGPAPAARRLTALYGWDYMHRGILEEAADLPTVEAMTAFMEAVLAITLDPWGIAGHPDQPHVTIGFGPAKQGHISYLIMDDRRMVYLTQIQWLGN